MLVEEPIWLGVYIAKRACVFCWQERRPSLLITNDPTIVAKKTPTQNINAYLT